MSPRSLLPAGAAIAGYGIEGLLGRGGTAVVYRASHPDREEPVALKLVAPSLRWDGRAQERFEREALLAAAVAHRGILPVYEAGEHEGRPFVAMKLEPRDLQRVLREEVRLGPARTVSLVSQLASALDAAHAHGLLHRDVKPSNVLLGEEEGDERTYLADFGLARAIFSDAGAQGDGMVGTVGFASPEQIRGEPVDLRTDVYALGCLLYECLTGRLPHADRDLLAILWRHLREEPIAPSVLVPDLPRGLDEVVRRALAKRPEERYASAGELAQAARDARRSRPPIRASAARERPPLPAGTVTLLAAEGIPEGRRGGVEATCTMAGGVVADARDDGVLVAFTDAGAALRAAGQIAAGPAGVRAGLHTGTPHATSCGYVGAEVDRVAAIAAAAHRGQVVLSQSTAACLTDDAVTARPLGSHRLAGLAEPVALFQLGEASFPALKSAVNTNLPTPGSSFLGRGEALRAVDPLLGGTRLLSVTGPGGAGKTRFALELARHAREERFPDYPDGVFCCFLAPLRDPALVLATIAQALSVSEQPGRSALEALAAQLGGRRLLLLVDNLEHLPAAAGELERLGAACPGLTLLVSSRERLHLAGETVYELPPLAADESVALFCERAACEPSRPIAELCARLEGLPLAIELAAARMSLLSPEQLLARLARRLDLLKAGPDADPRQQTLRATIGWSYDLLTPQTQTLFARLSVFAGGCTLDTAEAVCDADLDSLQTLLDKNLLRRIGDRYTMLETIREYAAERLEESGGGAGPRRRHAERFLALAEEAEPNLRWSGSPGEWLQRLEAEHDNLRAALDRLAAAGRSRETLRLAAALARFWIMTGHLAEGRDRIEGTLTADEQPSPTRGRALTGLAVMILGVDAAAARRRAEEALALNRRLGESWGAAYAAFLAGQAASLVGDLPGAQRLLSESLGGFRELGDDHYVLLATDGLAGVYDEQGDFARARPLHEENLRRARAQGNRRIVALSLDQLASYARDDGRVEDALSMLRESLGILVELDDRLGIGENLGRFARAFAVAGRAGTAAQLLAALEAVYDETGGGVLSWVAKMNEGTLSLIRDQLDEDAFARASELGRALTTDEAVALALEA
jgi:predicted ATPase/class 3 adenylate cyclase